MEKKKLLILYTKNPSEVFNRKSAIGSYVHSLANLLSTTFDVTLNYGQLQNAIANTTSNSKTSLVSSIKKLVPSRLKHAIRDRHQLKSIGSLTQQILSLQVKFDLILEFYNFGSDAGYTIAEKTGAKLHLIYDGPLFEEYEFFNGHKSSIEKLCKIRQERSFSCATKIVVYSKPMQIFCTETIHAATGKYKIHQNIDFSRFQILDNFNRPNSPVKICFVGSFLKWHRVDLLIQSFHELTNTPGFPAAELYLIGDGLEKAACEKLAHSLHVKNIHFLGYLDGNELFETQKKMHIGVMSGSNWYGAPNKIFEYGAMHMACVAPSTATICDLFDESELFLFENNVYDSLRNALRESIVNLEAQTKKSEALFMKIKSKYSAEKTRNFYTTLLSESN